jgi:hypothetical protein
MSAQDNGGPAFPVGNGWHQDTRGSTVEAAGMTLRQYAAIKLRVPDSGVDWLDEMIRQSLRDDLAARAFAMAMHPESRDYKPEYTAAHSYRFADAMLAARSAA